MRVVVQWVTRAEVSAAGQVTGRLGARNARMKLGC